MNLQEQISRIQSMMGLNEETKTPIQHIQKTIDEKILNLKKQIPSNVKSVLNPEKMIDDYRNYLISKIPETIEKSKTGQGGEQFAYQCYTKLMELTQNQINEISGLKKITLKKLAPSKNEFLNNSKNVDLDPFFETFKEIVDFPFLIGWMDQYKNYDTKMLDYSNQITNWVDKNKKRISNAVINKVSNFLYN